MLLFMGDLYLGEVSKNLNIDTDLKKWINNNQYIICNFENVLHDSKLKKREDKNAILTFTQEQLSTFRKIFNPNLIFTLGNNHMHDLGEVGIKHTCDLLEDNNILYCGVGNKITVNKPLIIEANGKNIAILPVSTDDYEVMSIPATGKKLGMLEYHNPIILKIINQFKKQVDFFIVLPHWGKELMDMPSLKQRKIAYSWIDAGADLVIGHHPHVIQGKEIYKSKQIYYSLGNFVFPSFYGKNNIKKEWTKYNQRSISLKIIIDDNLTIDEQGLFYNEYKNSLSFCREALQELHKKSVFLNTKAFQFKKYYSLWERNYYKVLSKNYNYSAFFKKIWIKHRDYNKIHFLLRRFYMKIHQKLKEKYS